MLDRHLHTSVFRCPESILVGLPLNCSVDSNFPVGTPVDIVFYRSSAYTSTPLSRQSITIQENHATVYQLFDTKELSGGQYKVEAILSRTDEEKLSTDSMTWQLPGLIDRAGEITITSPTSQTLNEALRIEGTMIKAGDRGVEIEVRGTEGVVFGPRWIDTKLLNQDGSGEFAYRITITHPGAYDVSFRDTKGYVGVRTFNVVPSDDTSTDSRTHNNGYYPSPDNPSCILSCNDTVPTFPAHKYCGSLDNRYDFSYYQ